MEALLRRMPLARPGDSMDANVLARRPRRVVPLAIAGGGTLAAAATLVLAFTLGWLGQHAAPAPHAPTAPSPAHVGYDDQLMPTERANGRTPLAKPGDMTNPSPTVKVRDAGDKTTWTGLDDSVHVEDATKPHDEEIHINVVVD